MANRPKRKKTLTSKPNLFNGDSEAETEPTENPDFENKNYRNQPKKRKPFVDYISIKKYKPQNLDKFFK